MHYRFVCYFSVLLLFLGKSVSAQNSHKKHLNDFSFGSPPDQYHSLSIEIRDGETALYSCGVSFWVRSCRFDDVRLTFTKNKLGIISGTTGASNVDAIVAELELKYGKLTHKKTKSFNEWENKKVKIVFEPIQPAQMMMTVYSKSLPG